MRISDWSSDVCSSDLGTSSSCRTASSCEALMVMSACFVGADVGTASARAGVFDAAGELLGTAKRDIAVHREKGGMVEQSSTDVWRAVSAAVKEAVARAAVAPADIGGIGFDATCSLVVLGDEGREDGERVGKEGG